MNSQRRETILSVGPVHLGAWLPALTATLSAFLIPVLPVTAQDSTRPSEVLDAWRSVGTLTIVVLPANDNVEDPVDEYDEEVRIVDSPPLDHVDDPVDEYEEEILAVENPHVENVDDPVDEYEEEISAVENPHVENVDDPVDEYEEEIHWTSTDSKLVDDPVDEFEEELRVAVIPLPYGVDGVQASPYDGEELRVFVTPGIWSPGGAIDKYGGSRTGGQVGVWVRGPVMLAVTRSLFRNGRPAGCTVSLVEDVRAGSYTFLLERRGEGPTSVVLRSVDVTVAFHEF